MDKSTLPHHLPSIQIPIKHLLCARLQDVAVNKTGKISLTNLTFLSREQTIDQKKRKKNPGTVKCLDESNKGYGRKWGREPPEMRVSQGRTLLNDISLRPKAWGGVPFPRTSFWVWGRPSAGRVGHIHRSERKPLWLKQGWEESVATEEVGDCLFLRRATWNSSEMLDYLWALNCLLALFLLSQFSTEHILHLQLKNFCIFKNNCLISLFRKLLTFSHLWKEISGYFGLNNYAIVIPLFSVSLSPCMWNWFLQTTQPPLYFLVPSMFLMQNKKVSICMNY